MKIQRLIASIGFLLLLTAFIGSFAPTAHTMGPPANACNNLYDGVITSFLFDGQPVIQNHTYTFPVPADPFHTVVYNITLTITLPAHSENGSTANGSIWFDSNIGGYNQGACLAGENGDTPPGVATYGPGYKYVLFQNVTVPEVGYPVHPPTLQTVYYMTGGSPYTVVSKVQYYVLWTAPVTRPTSSSITSTSTPTLSSTTSSRTTSR